MFQIPHANSGRVRGHGLLLGLFPPRSDVQEQTSSQMALGSLQSAGQEIQEEPQVTLSSPSYKFYTSRLELLQAHYQVRYTCTSKSSRCAPCVFGLFSRYKYNFVLV